MYQIYYDLKEIFHKIRNINLLLPLKSFFIIYTFMIQKERKYPFVFHFLTFKCFKSTQQQQQKKTEAWWTVRFQFLQKCINRDRYSLKMNLTVRATFKEACFKEEIEVHPDYFFVINIMNLFVGCLIVQVETFQSYAIH